jgi:EAL domain-containing protein (putative c-di-GMP-specific phosphodiesterase class I)
MGSLRALGCRFALDDFGIGFTSFSHLKTLPIDLIKIDGSFIRNLQSSQTDFGLVRAITQVAKLFGKEVVAEFVESEGVLKLLQSIGVDFAQGYHVGKPLPMLLDDFEPAQRQTATDKK